MAEKTKEQSRRESVLSRLKTRHPESEYADDEALFGQIDDDYAANDEQIGQYRDREEKLTTLLANNPKAAQFITDMAKGNDPWLAVIERLGIDGVTDLMNDPEKQEALAEANKKYVERIAKEKSLKEEYETNFAQSMQSLAQMQQERGLTDENVDAAMDMIQKIVNEAIVGKFTPETIDMALKAINHDADIDNARTEGEVAGRNAKIDEKVRNPKAGDGIPAMAGTSNGPSRRPETPQSIFDVARGSR